MRYEVSGFSRPGERGEPDVEDLDRAVDVHFEVGRLEIAVNHAMLMRRIEPVGNLPPDRHCLVERK
jgi:hypothetical protein